jgi:CubicO group peptidase (beta-lactamase class C family)
MAKLQIEVDPDEVGFDPARLARIDRHFAAYVDDGLLPGWLIAIARHGKVAHLGNYGQRDIEAGLPVELDTIFRIYSMTKPITSVAAMILYEEGAFELKDPVSRFIRSFADTRVWRGGSALRPVTDPQTEPMRIWHLLTHTSGLTYGFHHAHPVDTLYRNAGFEWGAPAGIDLAEACEIVAGLPLLFQPGAEWNYSMSTDVLGRVVEVASGQTLDEFFRTRIFEPLDMTETGFAVKPEWTDRLAALYSPHPSTRKATRSPMDPWAHETPTCLFGGGGLVGTAADYHRFSQMLINEGELDGVRVLGPRTVRYMARNHLPGDADLEAFGRPLFSETTFDGVGFGLGFSVQLDAAKYKTLSSEGEFAWGGAASTAFFIDPAEDLTALFMTQLLPSSTHPIRTQLKQLLYQALVD